MNRTVAFVLVAAIGLGVPATRDVNAGDARATTSGVKILEWKDLVPPDFDPRALLREYSQAVASLRDDDPRAARLDEALRKAWESAPVVTSLNNKTVRLSGFLVTLEGDGKAVSEFLLVPFFGACIHVPPPPSNQIVLVRTRHKPFKAAQMFQMVMVTGRLRTEATRSDLASASYVIEATHVELHTPKPADR